MIVSLACARELTPEQWDDDEPMTLPEAAVISFLPARLHCPRCAEKQEEGISVFLERVITRAGDRCRKS